MDSNCALVTRKKHSGNSSEIFPSLIFITITISAFRYVNKGRGELISESPVMTVRLNFEPSGRPSSEYDLYYLRDKANACVVCGRQETFLRKNIVPHEYRKHFPAFFKVSYIF